MSEDKPNLHEYDLAMNDGKPMPSGEEIAADRALKCLYIAVDESVADDVNSKVRAYFAALRSERDALKIEYESRAIWIEKMNTILGYDNSDGMHSRPDPHAIATALRQRVHDLEAFEIVARLERKGLDEQVDALRAELQDKNQQLADCVDSLAKMLSALQAARTKLHETECREEQFKNERNLLRDLLQAARDEAKRLGDQGCEECDTTIANNVIADGPDKGQFADYWMCGTCHDKDKEQVVKDRNFLSKQLHAANERLAILEAADYSALQDGEKMQRQSSRIAELSEGHEAKNDAMLQLEQQLAQAQADKDEAIARMVKTERECERLKGERV